MRILLVGGPGSGKSYAARHIRRSCGIYHVELDDLFWESSSPRYGVKCPTDIRDQKLRTEIRRKSWLVEGVHYDWAAPALKKADVVFLLNVHPLRRVVLIIMRSIRRALNQESSKRERLVDFIWMIGFCLIYDTVFLRRTERLIRKMQKPVMVFRSSSKLIEFCSQGDLNASDPMIP